MDPTTAGDASSPGAEAPNLGAEPQGSAPRGGAAGTPTVGGMSPSPHQPAGGYPITDAPTPAEGQQGADPTHSQGLVTSPAPQVQAVEGGGAHIGVGVAEPGDEPDVPVQPLSAQPPLHQSDAPALDPDQPPIEGVPTEEGITILQALAESANASWLGRAAALLEDAAPALLAIGLAAFQPEAAAVLVSEFGADVAEAADAAVNWATLDLERAGSSSGQPLNPPRTVGDVVKALRKEIEKPRTNPSLSQPIKLPEEARLQALKEKAARWANQRSADEWAAWRQKLIDWHAKKAALAAMSEPNPSDFDHPSDPVVPAVPDALPTTKEGKIWVKTGDHSIDATDITQSLFLDDEDTQVGPAEFFRVYANRLRDRADNFNHEVNVGYQIRSWVAQSSPGGGTEVPQLITGTIFPETNVPIPIGAPQNRNSLHIHTAPPREIERFTDGHVAGLYQGGRPSERFVGSALNPELGIPTAQNDVLRALTSSIEQSWEIYDNTLLYAKLAYYAFLHDLCNTTGLVLVPNEFVVAGTPTWINLAGNPNVADIPNALVRKDIVFWENHDIFPDESDLQLVYWLVKAGARFDGQEGQPTFNAVYTEWPSIPITVISRRVAPNAPAAVVLSSTIITQFMSRIASTRNEHRWLVKGIYMAMEILGMRMVNHGNEWRPLRSNWSAHDPWTPGCADYNFLFRLLKISPPDDEEAKYEVSAYLALSAATRTRAAALYNAVLQIASTTLLYDLNISVARLVGWCTGDNNSPSLFNAIMSQSLNNPNVALDIYEPVACAHPRRAFKLWLGVGVASGFWYDDSWNGMAGQTPGAVNAYGNMQQAIPPRVVSCLCIDAWLTSRPLEWGVVGLRPKVNLTHDLRLVGPAANQGWYGSRGSVKYAERVTCQFPSKVVVYGSQAINVICEVLRIGAAAVPQLSHQNSFWTPEEGGSSPNDVQWDAPVVYNPGDNPYIAALNIFEPCTIMTFDFVNEEVWAPCIIGGALDAADRRALQAYKGQAADQAGFLLELAGVNVQSFVLPRQLNFTLVGAFRGRQTPASKARPMDDANAPKTTTTAIEPAGNA